MIDFDDFEELKMRDLYDDFDEDCDEEAKMRDITLK